ncbi:hypothetical protein BCM02_11586 [Paenibacillus methanolicus]|uniref:DUF192 domain-containing protein n=2 Tax=Paenibacillus methanolicus TaxID=582686 RepID=A0A5S5BR63_9BACL|nr:hypothetical protein BCM02_11586 [Paenibacillus methanolicus]
MKLVIRESGERLGDQIERAYTFWRRLRGLVGRRSLSSGSGLHIQPCKSVHMFFMTCDLDVLHLDKAGVIVGMEHRLQPGRIGAVFEGTRSVVELPAGTLAAAKVELGQTAILEP